MPFSPAVIGHWTPSVLGQNGKALTVYTIIRFFNEIKIATKYLYLIYLNNLIFLRGAFRGSSFSLHQALPQTPSRTYTDEFPSDF